MLFTLIILCNLLDLVMFKWFGGIIVVLALVAAGFWFSIDKSIRYLMLHPPLTQNILFWTTEQRDAGFRVIEKLEVLPFNMVKKGDATSNLIVGQALDLPTQYVNEQMQQQRIAALLVLHNGELRLEEYGLDLNADDKWTSFSVAKSFTSTMIGAAIKDGYIKSLDDKVSDYIEDMRGSVYDDVSIEQLLTMTSGVQWNEDYSDPNSDVSKFNFHTPEPGVDATASYMRSLPRAAPAGERWHYSTGETNLIGLLLHEATGYPLAEYLSDKVWSHIGAEQDASWILGPTGLEIGGCCIQATPRDYLRFGQFVLEGAMVNGESILPESWLSQATTKQADTGSTTQGYGYQWWTDNDGSFQGKGIFGQGIFIDPSRNLVIAINSNWPSATSAIESQARTELYQAIQAAVDVKVAQNTAL